MKTTIYTSVLNMQKHLNHTYPTAQKNLDTTTHTPPTQTISLPSKDMGLQI